MFTGGFRGRHIRQLPLLFFGIPNCILFKRTNFHKLRVQKEPKSLQPDAFSGLKICQNCFYGWGSAPTGVASSAPPDSRVGFKGTRGEEWKGKEERRRRWMQRKGWKAAFLLSQIPGSAHGCGFKNIETLDSYTC